MLASEICSRDRVSKKNPDHRDRSARIRRNSAQSKAALWTAESHKDKKSIYRRELVQKNANPEDSRLTYASRAKVPQTAVVTARQPSSLIPLGLRCSRPNPKRLYMSTASWRYFLPMRSRPRLLSKSYIIRRAWSVAMDGLPDSRLRCNLASPKNLL